MIEATNKLRRGLLGLEKKKKKAIQLQAFSTGAQQNGGPPVVATCTNSSMVFLLVVEPTHLKNMIVKIGIFPK